MVQYTCDMCKRKSPEMRNRQFMPGGWLEVHHIGTGRIAHVCSDKCKDAATQSNREAEIESLRGDLRQVAMWAFAERAHGNLYIAEGSPIWRILKPWESQ